MCRGSALFSGLITIRSGASRISIGNRPSSHIAKIGPPGWQGTTFLMSDSRIESRRPASVNGGSAGHAVFDQGAGPAGSLNVPTATHTPVSRSSDAFDRVSVAAGAAAHDVVRTARATQSERIAADYTSSRSAIFAGCAWWAAWGHDVVAAA